VARRDGFAFTGPVFALTSRLGGFGVESGFWARFFAPFLRWIDTFNSSAFVDMRLSPYPVRGMIRRLEEDAPWRAKAS
jgi:hypothetical protein